MVSQSRLLFCTTPNVNLVSQAGLEPATGQLEIGSSTYQSISNSSFQLRSLGLQLSFDVNAQSGELFLNAS